MAVGHGEDQQALMGGQGGGGAPGTQHISMSAGNVKMNTVWFISACCVFAGGLIGAIDLLFTAIAPLDFLSEFYLMFFGGIMFVLDAPLHFKLILEVKQYISKYARFLTRLTGRGIWYIFLGTMTFATLWENSISYFLAVVLGIFVFAVGAFSTVFGYVKSRKLERVRVVVADHHRNNKLSNLYNDHAKTAKQSGLVKQEFNSMCSQVKGVTFDNDELSCIFSALVNGPRIDNLSMQDLTEWAGGKMVLL